MVITMLALFPTGIVKCSALPLSTTIKQTQSTMLCFLHSAIWHRLFSVNLRGCNAADAGGNAVPTDSSKSAPTDSYTCYALSSVYCFLIFAKTHIGNPNERTHTYIQSCAQTFSSSEQTIGPYRSVCQRCIQARKRFIQTRTDTNNSHLR